ncbi:hypothetical protein AAFF_G00347620 [Aldrovandia affinis]|uniref:Uncharacterized protein n=1 Tax=Aldrovandia affinis TaxID=143900 RepID=A0AAD7SJP5_9TELE|nr:hypothetical protein AAFF_G00347620 [Aldrovandia affinis]
MGDGRTWAQMSPSCVNRRRFALDVALNVNWAHLKGQRRLCDITPQMSWSVTRLDFIAPVLRRIMSYLPLGYLLFLFPRLFVNADLTRRFLHCPYQVDGPHVSPHCRTEELHVSPW